MKNIFRKKALLRSLVMAGIFGTVLTSNSASADTKTKKVNTSTESSVSTSELLQRLDALAAQNKILQEKVERLETAQNQQASQMQQQSAQVKEQAIQSERQNQAVEKVRQEIASNTSSARPISESSTTVSSYGEINYTRPTKSPSDANIDVARAVIGIQHRFDSKTKIISEFEWEHAITSSSDKGEAEVEQLWVEHELNASLRARAGLFLMPVGLINQNHEPTSYYGVQRPDVDTKIIPSTWREVGVGLSGDLDNGINWDIAVTTAPNLSKWDSSTTEGRYRGPLQSIHGEGQFAAARDFGLVGAINWRGVPGLLIGGSVVASKIGQNQKDFLGNDSKFLLLDVHGRYQVAGWDLSAEYIRGTISNTEALNASFSASSTVNPTLVPHLFYGGYVQAAYNLWHNNNYALSPFVRYEVLNTAAGFGSLSAAAGGIKGENEKIVTIGANFRIGEGVVLKADYRNYQVNKLPDTINHFNLGNSLNLGLGYSF